MDYELSKKEKMQAVNQLGTTLKSQESHTNFYYHNFAEHNTNTVPTAAPQTAKNIMLEIVNKTTRLPSKSSIVNPSIIPNHAPIQVNRERSISCAGPI